MKGQKVLLGVTGGIAAFKSAEIASLLIKRGLRVQVVMTGAATKFISPLTFRTITGMPVLTRIFDRQEKLPVPHIDLARGIDAALVAPATANFLGKLAAGLADNLLGTLLLAISCPVLIAPAMNGTMYRHPAVQANLKKIKQWGYYLVDPAVGNLACGEIDQGRMAEPAEIVAVLEGLLTRKCDLTGKTLLITAGPTREPLDPVRYLSNYSSGKMGYALADAARERGATVLLVSGPVALEPPPGTTLYKVTTALEMKNMVLRHAQKADVIIMAAAVADYRPEYYSAQKLKKGGTMAVSFEQNPDILLELGKEKEKKGYYLVGFAAETENMGKNAAEKMRCKNLDLIVANDLSQPGSGFGVETNEVHLFFKDGAKESFPLMAKKQAAHAILDRVKEKLTKR